MKANHLRTTGSRILRTIARVWPSGLLGLLGVLLTLGAQAQQQPTPIFFADDAAARQAADASPLTASLSSARALTLNGAGLRAALATAPLESQRGATPLVLALPLPDGTTGRFAVVEAPIMEPALAAQFPAIKTYVGVGLDDSAAHVRLDFTPLGFHAQVLSAAKGTFYIDPATRTDQVHYLSFWRQAMLGAALNCSMQSSTLPHRAAGTALRTSGTVLRTYRLAVAATGEYTAVFGGTVTAGQAAIVTTVNRVVGVYEVELAIRMVLVGNNSSLVYTNGTTDPYTNSNPTSLLAENQSNVTSVIGSANYDIGHVFSTAGGGLAGLGVVGTSSQKARGETGLPTPTGDAFAIDYVAHEMGHQFGANHTFNTVDSNRRAATAYEPGSGSTIMAYAGVFGGEDLQPHSDAYFHVASFEEILDFVDGTISTVGTRAATGNNVPAVSPGVGYPIPLSTPFALTATGTDVDGDVLAYCWEEYDLGPAVLLTTAQNTTSPLFRSFLPTTNPTRTFPRLTDLVANTSTTSEKLPTLARDLKFRVTARDNRTGGGGVNSSPVITLTAVAGTGPFQVTAPNTAVTWAGYSTQTVTWNVAGTTANGINCTQVSLLLSTDGGLTYPTTLLASTANDGSETITVPNTPTSLARVRVQAVGNVFFDISNTNFTIAAPAPVTAVSSVRTGASPTNAAMVYFTVTFSGPVSGVSPTGFSVLTTGSVAGASVLSVTGTSPGTTYTVAVNTGTGSGTVQLQLSTTAGISPTVSNVPFADETYTIDKTAPTAALSTTASSTTSTSPIPFSATFSEAVTGFSASGLSVTNGTVTGGTVSGSGSGPYTFTVTPTGSGPVAVSVLANAAQDAASNGNLASSPVSVTYSALVTLTTWTAGANTQDWFTAGNWSAGVPTASIDALIPAGVPFYPLVTAAGAVTRNLTINSPGSVTLASVGTLTVNGLLTNGGLITQSAGALTVNGNMSMSGAISKSAGTISVTGSLSNTGTLTQSGGDFAVSGSLTNNTSGTVSQVGGTLSVSSDLTNNGTFTTTNAQSTGGGTVLLGSATGATSNILGSQAIRFWNLTVQASGAQLSTSAGASVRRVLTLNGNFTTQGNVFTLESASTGTALVVNNGSSVVSGNATVQRYIDPSLNSGPGYRHYSAPVSTSTVGDLATPTGFTPVVNPAYNTAATPSVVQPFPTVYGYDEQRVNLANNQSAFDRGYVSPTALSDPLAVGRGYTVNIGASQLVDFVGPLNNGTLPLNLTSTRDTNPDGGWQLLGNPYPAPLNYNLVAITDREGLDGAIYVFSSTSQYGGQYRSFVNGFGNGVLPVGQSFFTRVSTGRTSTTLTFRNSQRLTVPDATAFQRTAETRSVVQLTLQGASSPLPDALYVYFEQGASDGFDRAFDAEKLPNPSGLNLASSLATGQGLSTDGRAPLGPAPLVVPLAVGVPAAGTYTLAAAQLLNLSQVPVYLRDKQSGALIDLAQQPSYTFEVSNAAALITGRFELVFSPQQALATVPAALAEQVGLYPNPAQGQVTIELPASLSRQPVTAALVDVLGRVVRQQQLPAGLARHALPLTDLATGVYAVRLRTELGTVVKKLVVE